MAVERVLLARPRNGLVHEESAIAAYCNDISGRFFVHAMPESRSLLTFNFNYAWCKFINEDWDLFAMQHSDMAPVGDKWLHALRDAMGERFDVIHAPAMIKDDRGITSTALGKRHHAYGPLRRLHVEELRKMPQPFGFQEAVNLLGRSDGQGGEWDCLMPNTGCLMVRRTEKTIKFHGFKQSDKLVFDDAGKATPATESEDWNFGRWCARNGVRVGGTLQVITRHFGMREFRTDFTGWNDSTDKDFKAPTPTPNGVEVL